MTNNLIRLTICFIILFSLCFVFTWAGDCLDTRKKMLADLKAGIEFSIKNPESEKVNLGPWINNCWRSRLVRDDGTTDDDFVKVVLWMLNHPDVPANTIDRVLKITREIAPQTLFSDLLIMLEKNEIENTEFASDIILHIWGRYSRKDSIVANLDFYNFIKKYKPSAFSENMNSRPPIRSLTPLQRIHHVLSMSYSNDYPAVRDLLIKWRLLGRPSWYIGAFNDPRAWEDVGYPAFDYYKMSFQNSFFYSLTHHLELEFKEEWIRKLSVHQQALLRNGIMATYGYKFQTTKYRNYFATKISNFCRNGRCGTISEVYDESLLTDVDRLNISLIRRVESEKQ